MIITLQLSSEVEEQLRESVQLQDIQGLRKLLEAALAPAVEATVEALLHDTPIRIQQSPLLSDQDFEALADELSNLAPNVPALSDEQVSRTSIYEDHA